MNSDCQKAIRPIPLALGLCAGIALIGLCFSAKFALAYGFAWHCPIMTLFHIPCPSCGSTRALAALANLQFGAAVRFNPLFVSALLLGPITYLFQERLARYAHWGWPALITAVLANWIYLLLFLPR